MWCGRVNNLRYRAVFREFCQWCPWVKGVRGSAVLCVCMFLAMACRWKLILCVFCDKTFLCVKQVIQTKKSNLPKPARPMLS